MIRALSAAWRTGAALLALLGCVACAGVEPVLQHGRTAAAQDGDDLVIVAVPDRHALAGAGGTSGRADYRRGSYFGSDEAHADARAIAQQHGMTELAAWTIAPLSWRCMLYRLPAGADREATLAALRRDARVQLAQASNGFDTLAELPRYNDPYLELQSGLRSIRATAAQQFGQGENVTVAVIDGAVDAGHPELLRRLRDRRDYVRGTAGEAATPDHHGTAVAGIIAATANNREGIVGVAPLTKLLALRACWPAATSARGGARCNTFTLAQALVAAISAGAEVINLSLGGPRDELLERLVAYAAARGAVVVGALPASGRIEGFPAAAPGVLVAAVAEGVPALAGTLAAPGRDILTLAPGGGYVYLSGSSMAAAHVSGAAALLKSIQPLLTGDQIARLLAPSMNLCRAASSLGAAGTASAGVC